VGHGGFGCIMSRKSLPSDSTIADVILHLQITRFPKERPEAVKSSTSKRRIKATTSICQQTTPSCSTLPATRHRPTGFLCGWSVGVEFFAGLLARFFCWRRDILFRQHMKTFMFASY